jgi:hypothetical protein
VPKTHISSRSLRGKASLLAATALCLLTGIPTANAATVTQICDVLMLQLYQTEPREERRTTLPVSDPRKDYVVYPVGIPEITKGHILEITAQAGIFNNLDYDVRYGVYIAATSYDGDDLNGSSRGNATVAPVFPMTELCEAGHGCRVNLAGHFQISRDDDWLFEVVSYVISPDGFSGDAVKVVRAGAMSVLANYCYITD